MIFKINCNQPGPCLKGNCFLLSQLDFCIQIIFLQIIWLWKPTSFQSIACDTNAFLLDMMSLEIICKQLFGTSIWGLKLKTYLRACWGSKGYFCFLEKMKKSTFLLKRKYWENICIKTIYQLFYCLIFF